MRVVPTRCCLIVTTPRTGSWLLAEALHETDLVGEPQEYFGWEAFGSWSKEFGLSTDASHLRFVEETLAYGTNGDGIFSAKMHWTQLLRFEARVRSTPGTWPRSRGAILQKFFPDLHCVHLFRADTARQAISYWRAVQAKRWWNLVDLPDSPPEVGVDYQQIRWYEEFLVRNERGWRTLLDTHDIPTLEVVYESFVEDRSGTVEKILDFLEIPHGRITLPPSRLKRQADRQTEEWLASYLLVRDDLDALPERWRWSDGRISPAQDLTTPADGVSGSQGGSRWNL